MNGNTMHWVRGDWVEKCQGGTHEAKGVKHPMLPSPTLGFHLPRWLPGPLPDLAEFG